MTRLLAIEHSRIPGVRVRWSLLLISIIGGFRSAEGVEPHPRAMSRLAPARIELVAPFHGLDQAPLVMNQLAVRDSVTNEASQEPEPLAAPGALAAPAANELVDGVDVRFEPIAELSIDTRTKSEDENDSVPQDFATGYFAGQSTVHYGPVVYHEHFIVPARRPVSQFAHGPVYFEDRNLERHGTSFGRLQPVASAAHFFLRVPALPYLAAAEPPWNDYYTADPYAAGYPAPRVRDLPEFNPRAATLQAGLAAGLIFLIP